MIKRLRLQQFRSYEDADFVFSEGATLIVGPNASGKTNLLEAVLVAARGSSYRAKDSELVQFGKQWARLDAETSQAGRRIVKFQADQTSLKKTFVIDEQTFARLTPQRNLPVVLFEPNHLLLMSGSPDLRRAFLDDLIEQTNPTFGAVRRHYKRVLVQRNALLKKNPADLREQLFVWNVRLSELGGKIASERQALINRLNSQMSELYTSLAGSAAQDVRVRYESALPLDMYETALLKSLEQSVELDVLRGFTARGPHRDDLSVSINGHPVQSAASRGETRSVVLALKILELKLIEQARAQKPLLLLDDVFSELDHQRRHALTSFVSNYQTLITTTDADVAKDYFDSIAVINTTIPQED